MTQKAAALTEFKDGSISANWRTMVMVFLFARVFFSVWLYRQWPADTLYYLPVVLLDLLAAVCLILGFVAVLMSKKTSIKLFLAAWWSGLGFLFLGFLLIIYLKEFLKPV